MPLYLTTLLAATLLFGSSFPATKVLLADLQPLSLVAMRFFCAALSLLPVMLLMHRAKRLTRLREVPWARVSLVALLQTTGSMGLLNLGLQSTSPAHASIIMASNPLLVALLTLVLFNERLRWLNYAGLLLAFAGVVICIASGAATAQTSLAGDALVAAGAACWALSTLYMKHLFNKGPGPGMNVWEITFWQMLLGSLLLLGMAMLVGETPAWPATTHAWLAFAWLAWPATTGAMVLWFKALQLGGAVLTSSFLFLSPLFAILISWALLGYPLRPAEIAGGVIIGVGIALLSSTTRKREPSGF